MDTTQVRMLQGMLIAFDPEMRLDGVMGPQTRNALAQLPPDLQKLLEETVGSVYQYAQVNKASRYLTENQVQDIILRVSLATDVPISYLNLLLGLEPKVKFIGGKRHYDAAFRNGKYFGLAQMGEKAWADAKAIAPGLVSFKEGWSNPEQNLLAAAYFYKANTRYALTKYGRTKPLTDEIAYAMHNQGHSVYPLLAAGRKLNFPEQSIAALRVMRVASNQF